MRHAIKAAELFIEGYNCAQAVAVAFCDVTGLDEKTAAKQASGFGGGVGGMREVCGAVSGMVMVLSHLYGYDDPADNGGKKRVYGNIQELADAFEKECGSVICRELMKHPAADVPAEMAVYCAKRPCAKMVMVAADLLDGFITGHPME